ncbi:MAG: MT-A70 family methyltransferase [Geminicoccaceae bacterium]
MNLFEDLPQNHFKTVLADPPWNFQTYSKKGRDRCPDARHYDVMNFGDLVAMSDSLRRVIAKDCALFMWVTDPMLQKSFNLLGLWGFEYKTVAFTWAKTGKKAKWPIGTGYWTRANPEMCLLATRGKPSRKSKAVRQLIVSPRREHSRKPDETHDRIEALVDGPYLELFARAPRDGWTVWGNQTERFEANGD